MKMIRACALLSLLHCLAAQISSSSGPTQPQDSDVGLTGLETDFIDGSPITPPCEIFPLTEKLESIARLDDPDTTAATLTNGATTPVQTTATVPTPVQTSTATTTLVPTSTPPTTTLPVSTGMNTTTLSPTSTTTATTTKPSTSTTTITTTKPPTSTNTNTTSKPLTSTTTTVRPVVQNKLNPVLNFLLTNHLANTLAINRGHIPLLPPHGGPFFGQSRFQSDSSEED